MADSVHTANSFIPFGGLHTCTKCNQRKTLDNFIQDRNRKSGLYVYCGSCRGVRKNSYVRGMIFSQREKDQMRLYGRWQAKGARCAICGGAASDIDHNHTTGLTRGDLCRSCNTLVGYLETKSHLLDKAHTYLERWK